MKYVIEQQPSTIAFSASNPATLVIGAKTFWTTAMVLDYELDYSTGTSPAGRQDSLFRGLAGLSLMGGGRPYIKIGAPDTRILYWHTRLRHRGRNRVPDFNVAASQSNLKLRYSLPLIFGVNPVNPDGTLNYYDRSCGIAPDQDLTLQVNWGVPGSTSTTTIWGVNVGANNPTLLRVTLFGIVPESNDLEPRYYPSWHTTQWSPSQAYSGLSGTIDLAQGFFFRRTALMLLNGSSPVDNRVDGMNSNAISEVGIKTADNRTPINAKTWTLSAKSQQSFPLADDNSWASQSGGLGATIAYAAAAAGVPHNPGVIGVDWTEITDTRNASASDPLYGLNMVNKQAGAAKLAFTVDAATNTSVVALHEAMLPY